MGGGRIWLLVGGMIGVLVIGLGWLVGGAPLFAQADQSDLQRRGVESQNQQYAAQLAHMKELDSKKDELLAEYGALKSSVPATHDLEGYFDWIAEAANQSAIVLASAVTTKIEDYKPADDPAGTIQLDSDFQSKLRLVQVTLSIGGDADQVATFLHLLQSDGRLQLITRAEVALGTSLTTQIIGYIFVIEDSRLVALDQTLAEAEGGSSDGGGSTSAPDDGTESPAPADTPTPPADTPTPAARR